MKRILNQQIKDNILLDLADLREKCPEINWDNPTGDLVDSFMYRAKQLGLPNELCIPSTYSTENGISIQLDFQLKFGLVEHFNIGPFGLSMRSYTVQELLQRN